VPGALLQIAAIQSAASERHVTIAVPWVRLVAGISLGFLFGLLALTDNAALTIGEHELTPPLLVLGQVGRTILIAFAGPCAAGVLAAFLGIAFFDLWLPMGYPVTATSLLFVLIMVVRFGRHRATFRRLYRTAGRYLPKARLAALARDNFGIGEGQEREVSILLVDLIGFTAFSNADSRTASEVVAVANRYFTLMQATIDRHGGCSDKFLGDAVLAFWNGFAEDPDHALKAVVAAQEILREVADTVVPGSTRLSARAVVCSGRVYVGDLGAADRSNFTIIGPAVNETFRLEKLPDAYGLPLLVAASTRELIETASSAVDMRAALRRHVLERIDDVELKGFPGRRSIYALVPEDDPGRRTFEAARAALDLGRHDQAAAQLGRVTGTLGEAARTLSARMVAATAES
jgi:class 3 adenylate cyclase